jgi:hypothetical protein
MTSDCTGELERLQVDHTLMAERVVKLEYQLSIARQERDAARKVLKERSPYGYMCMAPERCAATGRCPLDPVCGN